MESTIQFEAPYANRSLTVMLFTNVTNISEIISAIKGGSIQPEATFMDAAHVVSLFVAQSAAYHALCAEKRNALKSRTLHSEVVYNISASNHIAESYRRFGPTDHTKHILVARFDATPDDLASLRNIVKGTEVSPKDLDQFVDQASLAKVYKFSGEEKDVGSLESAVLGRIAIRDC